MDTKEKRATDRFKPVKAITVAVESAGVLKGFGLLADISESGACVITNVDLCVGAEARLALSFPRSGALVTRGKVRWVQPNQGGTGIRCGMQFEPGPSTDHDRLQSLIAEHAAA